MPTMIRFYSFLFIALVTGCTTANTLLTSTESSGMSAEETTRHNWMIGKWYGNQSIQGGGKYEWLMSRGERGEYNAKFRVTDAQGKVQSSEEFGLWGMSGDVYFSIFLGHKEYGEVHYADSSDPYSYDAYYILSVNENSMKYRHARDGAVYSVERVTADFTF